MITSYSPSRADDLLHVQDRHPQATATDSSAPSFVLELTHALREDNAAECIADIGRPSILLFTAVIVCHVL
eukprot:9279035-Heterocapsa_arctica.AAC.1